MTRSGRWHWDNLDGLVLFYMLLFILEFLIVGSAILSSSAGVISAIAIGMVLGGSYSKNRNKK